MEAKWNQAEVERLIAEAREDDEAMLRPDWCVLKDTGPHGGRYFPSLLTHEPRTSFERLVINDSATGQPCTMEACDALADAIARTRNNLRAMADQLEAARAEINALAVARNQDRTEWMTTYATMRAEIEILRCGDVDAYFHGELSPERRAAFEPHLGRCATCQSEIDALLQVTWVIDSPPREPWAPQGCTDSIACPLVECAAQPGERCKTDRPVHVERWDAWKAAGFRRSP